MPGVRDSQLSCLESPLTYPPLDFGEGVSVWWVKWAIFAKTGRVWAWSIFRTEPDRYKHAGVFLWTFCDVESPFWIREWG